MSHRLHVWPWTRALGRRLLLPNWLAISIGRHIVSWRELNEVELAHELEHVRQWRRHGWRFPIAYLAASLRARGSGHWYRDNPYEVAARTAATAAAERRRA